MHTENGQCGRMGRWFGLGFVAVEDYGGGLPGLGFVAVEDYGGGLPGSF
jgi:hypothetical protein